MYIDLRLLSSNPCPFYEYSDYSSLESGRLKADNPGLTVK